MQCPTVKIKSTHPESQGAYVDINESDFDPEKGHELYVEPAAEAAAVEPAVEKQAKKK
jgi:hypothetical protein